MEEQLATAVKRGRPPGSRNRTLADLAPKHKNEVISDELFWQLFNQWWKGAGHPDEIAVFVTIGAQHYGGNTSKAIRQSIRYILSQGLWG